MMNTYEVTVEATRGNDTAQVSFRVEATTEAFAEEFVCRAFGMPHLSRGASTWNTPLASVTVKEVTP